MMKEELYKNNYEKYTTIKYKDRSSILPSRTGLDDYLELPTKKHPLFLMEETFYEKEKFDEHFSNQMYSVMKEYIMIVIEKNGDKVVLKLFQGFKARRAGKGWFKINKNVDYISVNTKTGDVYNGFIHGYQRKRKANKKIRRNSFFTDPLNTLKSHIKNILSYYTDKGYEEVTTAFSIFLYNIDQKNNFETLNFGERLFRFYLNKRGIKFPNNFSIYANELYGPEIKKLLKKNDNKLVDTIMVKYGLNGRKIKKALHQCERLNVYLYQTGKKVFGDWLSQEEDNLILCLLNSQLQNYRFPEAFSELVSKEELRRVYSLFKQVYIHENLDTWTFFDHVRMYTELRLFGETDLKWYSFENKEDFRKEHLDWTDKLEHYRKGTYQRVYPEYMYEMISKPILEVYHPVLLHNSLTYNDESNLQSNCVKGYIGKPSSIIISVRTGELLDERATIEYELIKKDNVINANRIQSLGKYNHKLEEHWTPILLKLDEQVLSCIRDKRYEPVKLIKECHNGTILNSDTHWNSEGKLRWVIKNIENNYPNAIELI